MTSISSPGIGSGLDVKTLVANFVAADRAGDDNRLNIKQSTLQGQLGAFTAIGSGLSSLQSALSALQGTGSAFAQRTATSSDPTVFSASANAGATPSTYSIEVRSLATAHQLASSGFQAQTSFIGTGQLTIGSGSQSFTINLDSTTGTPAGIRDAINAATNNTGVTASMLSGDDGVHLVLTSTATGTSHAITVTTSGGDGGLAALVYDPANSDTQLTQLTQAKDSVVAVNGYTTTSGSNTVTSSIPGVTLSLNSASVGTVLTLKIAADTSSAQSKIASFVSAYNAAMSTVRATMAYDPGTKTASALTGDSLARTAATSLQHALGASLAGTSGIRGLVDLGITTQDDGTLAIDSSKLSAALGNNPDAVSQLFSTTSGVGAAMHTALDRMVGTNGLIDSRTQAITQGLTDVATNRADLDERMAKESDLMTAQYSALDSLMGQLNSTASFLTRQFGTTSS